MDPLTERPRPYGDVDDPGPDVGLADLVDHALVRLDGLRDRPRLSSAITALLVFGLVVGWGLTRWRAVEPIDDRIPRVEEMISAGVAPADSDGSDGGGGLPRETDPAPTIEPNGPSSAPAEDEGPPEVDVRLVIHVSGAVNREGLVELSPGSRLADAIGAAGGATATADIHRLNLATPLVDGMHIRVPEQGEEGADAERPLIETAQTGSGSWNPAGTIAAAPGVDGGRVNINLAGVIELQRLPGIGPATAEAIVTWRDDNGPFGSVDELLDVPGIGPAKLAAIEDQVVL